MEGVGAVRRVDCVGSGKLSARRSVGARGRENNSRFFSRVQVGSLHSVTVFYILCNRCSTIRKQQQSRRLLHDHQKISNTIESSTHTCSATHENTFTIKPLARESRPWSRHDSRHDSTVRSPHTTTSRGAASHVEGGLHLSLTLDLALPLHSSGRDSPTNKERARTQTQRRSHRTACPPDRADHTYRQARGGRRGRVRRSHRPSEK